MQTYVCADCDNTLVSQSSTARGLSLEKPLAHGDKLPNKGLLIEKGYVRGASDEGVNAAVVVFDKRHVETREIHAGVGGRGRSEQRVDHFSINRTPNGVGGGGGAVLDARRVIGNVLRARTHTHTYQAQEKEKRCQRERNGIANKNTRGSDPATQT
jgi:hypothetical protein